MNKKIFEDELILGMQRELVKQASSEAPDLSKAAECLHAALEIFEQQGLHSKADQVLSLLEKIAQQRVPVKKEAKIHSLHQLMEAGVSQRDLREFARGNPIAIAKLNLALRKFGLSDHEISQFLGPTHLMSEDEARQAINPNEPGSILEFKNLAPEGPEPKGDGEFLEFKSTAGLKKKSRNPGRPDKDPATRGLTPKKEVKNLLEHGHPLNVTMADDNFSIDVPSYKNTLDKDDMFPEFSELLESPYFDVGASDDELMGIDIKEDSLEVFENDASMEDFEDERD